MSQFTVNPIKNKAFGAVVTGISLRSLRNEEFADLEAAFLQYGFLVFPGQFLTEEENIAFGKRFGKLEFGSYPMSNRENREDGSQGGISDLNSEQMRINVGNETWHTDSTYRPISSKCAMLSAVAVPDKGGETELADMRAGYAALDQATRDRIEGLSAFHSGQYSQANDVGHFPPQNEESIYDGQAYLRPLVKVHPQTGVKNLFVGRHAFAIPGLDRQESRALLQSLVDFVVADDRRVYSHKWTVGDTLLWDNRALLHRARPYDYRQARELRGTRIAGDPATELAYFPDDPEAQAGRDALAAELERLRQEWAGRTLPESERAGADAS